MADDDEQRARSAADRLADLCVDVVGPGLRSVVLHGSLAAGGFRPGRSDIDLLAVVDGGLSDSQAAAVEHGVRTADAGPADRVDLHVVTSESARHPSVAPALELQVGRYGDEVEVARRVTDADLLAELSMARANGRVAPWCRPGGGDRTDPARLGRRPQPVLADHLVRPHRRREERGVHGADRLPDVAVRPRARPLLEARRRRVGAGTRPVPGRRTAGGAAVRRGSRCTRRRPTGSHGCSTSCCGTPHGPSEAAREPRSPIGASVRCPRR